MIKINKDVKAVPLSLIPAFIDLFPDRGTIPVLAKTTHEKRLLLIKIGAYIDKDEYNDRYKKEDIRDALKTIYSNKCAYCEQKIEQYHIEHYRPKDIYYWLAFSWDNLIMACPTCNQNKGVHFELIGEKTTFINNDHNLRNINNISSQYDIDEQPKMVNPEITDPLGKIKFQKNGLIESKDLRFAYTIEKCKIDRDYLNDERRKLLDIYRRDIRDILIENEDAYDQKKAISIIIRKFIQDSKDLELQFLGFRRYAIISGWLNDIIKEMN
jgi:uncharacterized protein (TIGR02646 family)